MNILDRGVIWLNTRTEALIRGREIRDYRAHNHGLDIETYFKEKHDKHDELLTEIKKARPELEALFKDMQYDYEDGIYRLYHYSFKVYRLQKNTLAAVALFKRIGAPLGPWGNLNDFFETIVRDGTSRGFRMSHNRDWLRNTRPIVEAFLHTRYFVEMMLEAARDLETAPNTLPSGWASVLYLFELR